MKKITKGQDMIDFYHAFSTSDFKKMAEYIHPDCILDFPGNSFGGRTQGRDTIIEKFKGIQAAMGGTLLFECRQTICSEELAAVHWFTSGQPAHGGEYLNRGVAWFGLKDGLIFNFQDFLDTEILSAFWPNGQPAEDLSLSRNLVEKLKHIK